MQTEERSKPYLMVHIKNVIEKVSDTHLITKKCKIKLCLVLL